MNFPTPPFQYKNVRSEFFVPTTFNKPILFFGFFPIAPTGPFNEIWEIDSNSLTDTHKIKSIFVDNLCRKEAGIRHWNMPKKIALLELEMNLDNSKIKTTPAFNSLSSEQNIKRICSVEVKPYEFKRLCFQDHGKGKFFLDFFGVFSEFSAINNNLVEGNSIVFHGDIVLSAPISTPLSENGINDKLLTSYSR